MVQHAALAVNGIDQSQWFGHSLAVPVGTVTKVPHLVLRVIDWPSANNMSKLGSSISGLFEDHLSLVAEGTVLYSAIARFHRSVSIGSVMMLVDVPVFHVAADSGLQLSLDQRNIRAVFAAGTAAWRDVTTCPPLLPFNHSSNSSLSSTRLLSLLDLPSPVPLSRAPTAGRTSCSSLSPATAATSAGTAGTADTADTADAKCTAIAAVTVASPSVGVAPATSHALPDDDNKVNLQADARSLSPKQSTTSAWSLTTSSRIFVVSPSDLFGSSARRQPTPMSTASSTNKG
jgi:hypothetical protein